jgi:hypothetical protein
VTVSGTGLAQLGSADFDFDGLDVVVQAGATDTTARLVVSVPHGTALGAKDLSLTTGTGSTPGLVTVTAITAGPTGNDVTNDGTDVRPFRTYRNALSAAGTGDTIQLKNGTYDAEHGETWEESVPAGATVQGEGPGTVLSGPNRLGVTSTNGLTFEGNGTVRDLTVSYFNSAAYVDHGNVSLEDVRLVTNSANGLEVSGTSSVSITITGDSTLSENVGSGLWVQNPAAVVTMNGTSVNSNGASGVYIQGTAASLTITGGEINGNTQNGVDAGGYSGEAIRIALRDGKLEDNGGIALSYWALGGGHPTIELTRMTVKGDVTIDDLHSTGAVTVSDSTFHPSTAAGAYNNRAIQFGGITGGVTLGGRLRITGSRFVSTNTAQFPQGLLYIGSGIATIRSSRFEAEDIPYCGLEITAGTLDLGTAAEAGGNTFVIHSDASHFGLCDMRSAAGALQNITVSDTSFNGVRPSAGTVATGPVDVEGAYRISAVGPRIAFY